MSENLQNNSLFSQVVDLLQQARQQVVRTINQTMVYTYYEIGRMIVEEEQNGNDRAEYGKQLLKGLSKRLTQEFGKGFSIDNLENMRKFYVDLLKFRVSVYDFKIKIQTCQLKLNTSHRLGNLKINKIQVD